MSAHAQLATTTTLAVSPQNPAQYTPVTIQISVSDAQGPVTAGIVDLFNGRQLVDSFQLVHSNAAGFTPGTITVRRIFAGLIYQLHASFRPTATDAASMSQNVQVVFSGVGTSYSITPVYKNTRDFTFGSEYNFLSSPAIADFNGDGAEDMAVAVFEPARLAVAAGDPAHSGEFLAPQFLTVNAGDLEHAYAVDANADGLVDLIAVSVDDSTLFYFQNNPAHPGSFLAPAAIPANVMYPTCRIEDLNLDGFPDIVCVGNQSTHGAVEVLLNDAAHPGTFKLQSIYSLTGTASTFTLADFNGDHFLDIAIGEFAGKAIDVIFGSSANPGTFVSSVTSYATSGGVVDLQSGDANGDGLPDLVIAQGAAGAGVMLNQTGQQGVFGAIQPLTLAPEAGTAANVIRLGAVDADRIPDIVVAGTNNYLSILPGRGDGSFEAAVPLMTGPTAPAFETNGLTLADVDGDGFPDILSSSYRQNAIEIFRHSAHEELIRTATDISGLTVIRYGQLYTLNITETATSGMPTGDVEIYDTQGGGTFLSQGKVPLMGTSAVYQSSTLALGFHAFAAAFHGDSVYAPSQSVILSVVVIAGPTAGVQLTASPNPAVLGQTVNLHATVSALTGNAGQPTGVVAFLDGASTVIGTAPLVNGVADLNVNTLTRGTHVVTARYNGNADYLATSSSAVNVVITGGATSTGLSASPNPVPYQAGTTLTATVTAASAATGSVTFYEGATVLGSSPLNASGVAQLAAVQLSPGAHPVHAVYSGDASFEPSTSSVVTVNVLAAPTTITAEALPASAVAFQNMQLRATVISSVSPAVSTQGGTVTFYVNGAAAGTGATDASGVAVAPVTLPAGSYTLTASFAATSLAAASTSAPVAFTVGRAPTVTLLSISTSPVFQHQTVTLQAVVNASASTHVADGAVSFTEGGNVLGTGTLDAQGKVTISVSSLAPGVHTLVATYGGSANFLPSSSSSVALNVLSNDFTVGVDPDALSIKTEHHAPVVVSVHSIGGFAGRVTLACADLPIYASCTFDKQALTLAAGETATTRVMIDTDTVLGYASVRREARNGLQLCLLGLGGIALFAVPRRRGLLRSLWLAVFLISTTWLSGCSGRYPDHTPPGVYVVKVVGEAPVLGVRSAEIALTVTP